MRFALVGYGKMGREIERVARDRGHRLVAVVDPSETGAGRFRSVGPRALAGVEVAFEFTVPSSAESNVVALLERHVPVVCGTTGWDPSSKALASAAGKSRAGAVVAPNFSVGMHLFYRAVRSAAAGYVPLGWYDPYVVEQHHRSKTDAPSGTARKLAALVAEAGVGKVRIGMPKGGLAPGDIHVASVRAGREVGVHTVGFDGEHEVVTLTHRSRGRAGFALGAVLAAEWIRGRRGVHGFDEVVDELVPSGKEGRR